MQFGYLLRTCRFRWVFHLFRDDSQRILSFTNRPFFLESPTCDLIVTDLISEFDFTRCLHVLIHVTNTPITKWFFFARKKSSSHCANVQECDTKVNEFEPQFRYYVHQYPKERYEPKSLPYVKCYHCCSTSMAWTMNKPWRIICL